MMPASAVCMLALLLALFVVCGQAHNYDLREYKRVTCVRNTIGESSGQLLFTDRNRHSKKFSGYTIDWYNWQDYVKKLVYRCGLAAKNKNLEYFGIQKHGECWARDFPLGDHVGRGKRTASEYECIRGDYRVCPNPPHSSSVCVGEKYSSFMYRIVCKPKVSDVVIAVDSSASITGDMFANLKSFLKGLVAYFAAISGHGSHVVVLGFDSTSRLSAPNFASSSTRSLKGVRAQIDRLSFTQGATVIQDALAEVKRLFFSRGARKLGSVQRVVVIFTDGQTFGGKSALQEPARKLRYNSGAQVIAIGVGPRESIDTEALKIITGGNYNFYIPKKYDDEDELNVMSLMCEKHSSSQHGDSSSDSDSDSEY